MDIAIYDVIDSETAQAVKRALVVNGPVTIHINSPGGSVTDALAIYSSLRKHSGRVTAIVDGLCASAATIIMLAADEVVMAEHSLLMVHNPWTVASGDAEEMRKAAATLDMATVQMTSLYVERTGLGAEAVSKIMGAETWYNSHEAVEAGFAHRVDTHEKVRPRLAAQSMAFLAGVVKAPAEAALCRDRMTAARQRQIDLIFSSLAGSESIQNIRENSEIMSKTPDQIRATVMSALGADVTPSLGAHVHVGNGDIVRDGMIDALATRLGVAKAQDPRNPYRTMSLIDMARASLTEKGVAVSGIGSKMQLVGAAFTHTSSDFGNVLMDVSQKTMLAGWEGSGETFQAWTKKGSLSNFHTARRVGLAGFPALPKVPEGAEYKYVTAGDHGSPIALATYGGLFSITRQAIINDDLSAFSSIPSSLGRSASRTIGDLVYAILTGNPGFTDGNPLFSTEHGNLSEAVGMNPGTLGDLRRMMRMQADSQGNTLNIAPAFVIVPAALESMAMQVLTSTAVPGVESNSGIANPVNRMGQLIVESRLDKASTTDWYVAAAQGSDTIEVAYLDGVDVPYLEQQEGWTVDGVSFKVRIDAGVAPLDYRGLAKAHKAA